MRRVLILLVLMSIMAFPVSAIELAAPEVPHSGRRFMPDGETDFAAGLWQILMEGLGQIRPDLREAARVCLGILAAVMILSILLNFSGRGRKTGELAGVAAISLMLLDSAGSMIRMAAVTVGEISEYGKLLLPVMTSTLTAQGGPATSAALYAGTLVANTVLSGLIAHALTPLIYLYLALGIARSATGEKLLKKIQGMIKWVMTWTLKVILYAFTGYLGITGVVSGSTDAAALKAAKLTISGVVPVVGGILSDASEAVLVGAGLVKNAAGIYGMLAIVSVWIGPFLKIGSHYLLLKAVWTLSGIFDCKPCTDLVGDFSTALGFLLAMTGSVCLMLVISTVCFMRGVG